MKRALASVILVLAMVMFPYALLAQQHDPTHTHTQTTPGEQGVQPDQQPGPAQAPQSNSQMQTQQQHQHGGMHEQMMQKCKEMMAKRQKMMTRMKEMDDSLAQKVSAMNEATGEQKVEAMAAVINEMADQRREVREMMEEMHKGGMMQGMGKGRMGGMGQMDMMSMGGCPMMQMMHGQGAHSGGAHTTPQ